MAVEPHVNPISLMPFLLSSLSLFSSLLLLASIPAPSVVPTPPGDGRARARPVGGAGPWGSSSSLAWRCCPWKSLQAGRVGSRRSSISLPSDTGPWQSSSSLGRLWWGVPLTAGDRGVGLRGQPPMESQSRFAPTPPS
jgi:hypothetical protein